MTQFFQHLPDKLTEEAKYRILLEVQPHLRLLGITLMFSLPLLQINVSLTLASLARSLPFPLLTDRRRFSRQPTAKL